MSLRNLLEHATALYVEADARTRAHTGDVLQGHFRDLLVARDGLEALQQFAAEPIHLVITDLHTPELTGFELARAIRAQDRELPILMTSDAARPEELLQAVRLNLVDYLIKPVPYARLKQALLDCAQRVQESGRLLAEIGPDLVYDAARKAVVSRERSVPLSVKEAALLELLLRHRGQLVTKKRIAGAVYGDDEVMTDSALKNLLLKLRRKVGRERLVNVYNSGFMLTGDVDLDVASRGTHPESPSRRG